MSLLIGLIENRDQRIKNLRRDWMGPISYNPLEFFSVFKELMLTGFISYNLTIFPWSVIMTICSIWIAVAKLWLTEHAFWIIDGLSSLQALTSLLGATISILLAFRLARAAIRFYDARAAAGKMIEICRTSSSQAIICGNHDHSIRDQFLRWTVTYPFSVKNHLRAERGTSCELIGILSDAEFEQLSAASHQPIFCLHRMRVLAWSMAMSQPSDPVIAAALFQSLSTSIDILTAAMGAMERISNTPLPFTYTAHLRVFLSLYLLAVCAAHTAPWGWLAVPAMAMLAFLLLGTESAAAECERPFRKRCDDLNLEHFCSVVVDNVALVLSMKSDLLPLPPLRPLAQPLLPPQSTAAVLQHQHPVPQHIQQQLQQSPAPPLQHQHPPPAHPPQAAQAEWPLQLEQWQAAPVVGDLLSGTLLSQ